MKSSWRTVLFIRFLVMAHKATYWVVNVESGVSVGAYMDEYSDSVSLFNYYYAKEIISVVIEQKSKGDLCEL